MKLEAILQRRSPELLIVETFVYPPRLFAYVSSGSLPQSAQNRAYRHSILVQTSRGQRESPISGADLESSPRTAWIGHDRFGNRFAGRDSPAFGLRPSCASCAGVPHSYRA